MSEQQAGGRQGVAPLATAPGGVDDRPMTPADEAAFEALFNATKGQVYDYIARLVRHRAAAEDLFQTVFALAHERRVIDLDAGHARGWLFTTASHVTLTYLRDTRTTEPMDAQTHLAAPGPSVEDVVVTRDAADLVWEAVDSLDARHRVALDLRLRRGFSTPEIAPMLAVTPRTAAELLRQAKDALRTAVRALLVVRRRGDCPALAKLVPTHAVAFTSEQRRTVDRHMRRCPACRTLADRLTAPAELFGGLVLLPLPESLQRFDPSWLRKPRPSAQGATLSSSPAASATVARRVARGPFRGLPVAPAALATIAGVVVLGSAGGVVAVTHRGTDAPAPAPAAVRPTTSAVPTTSPAAAASAAFPAVTPTPAPPVDEGTKSTSEIWADTLTDVRQSSSYHITYSTTAFDTDATSFDMHFTRSGDFAGTITLATSPRAPLEVRQIGGTMYVHGPSVAQQPDIFGLTAGQATQLGDAWLVLGTSGSQADVATLTNRAVAPFASPRTLADGILSPDPGAATIGTDVIGSTRVIVLRDPNGTLDVTDAPQPYPVRLVGPYDTLELGDFNAAGAISAPSIVQRIPSG